ncbi:MAG: AMP-binding protein, partial [Actinobacteria bacterium]|nr:AMP-binding protein [Actinomycetota bacterium]
GDGGSRTELSYARFATLIHRTAHAFRAVGVGFGDRVLLQLGNGPEVIAALFGLAEIGAVAVPAGMSATSVELARTYRRSGARWAVVEEARVADHLALRREPGLAGLCLLVAESAGTRRGPDVDPATLCRPAQTEGRHLRSLAALRDAQPATRVDEPRLTDQTVLEVLYTSGTTAEPKGVMITHANVVFSGHYGVWQTSLRSDDRLLTTMPSCHSNFQLAALTPVLVAGATLVVADRYSASRFWSTVRTERATIVQLIAMMARTLMLQPPSPEDGRHELRDALYFMPLSDPEKAEFERRFRVRLLNSYGSTESIGWAVTDPPQGERRWPSVGRAGLGYEVAIVDEHGVELPTGQVGEFRIKGVPGRSLMLGYVDDPAGTAAALSPDGWLRTHDQGYQDRDGWFYFVDRSINLIKRAGENVSATEVECVLTAHPLVAEAAVVGVPDPVRDVAVKAFVRLRVSAASSRQAQVVEQLLTHCRERLAPYKVPELVEIVDDFPRTDSMKIEKRLLH